MTARTVMGTSRLARWVGAPAAVAAMATLGVDATAWAAAQKACASLAPTPPGGAESS